MQAARKGGMQHGEVFHQDANNINMLTFFLIGFFGNA
jgi:hypothetical protein